VPAGGAALARQARALALAVAADVAGLTRRVAELEKVLEDMLRKQGIIAWLNDRIEALEQRPSVQYKGVYTDEAAYVPGHMVTDRGSVWHCKSACQGQRPPGNCWTLAVKHGRDGKDAQR
jgi:hypothetical protein